MEKVSFTNIGLRANTGLGNDENRNLLIKLKKFLLYKQPYTIAPLNSQKIKKKKSLPAIRERSRCTADVWKYPY